MTSRSKQKEIDNLLNDFNHKLKIDVSPEIQKYKDKIKPLIKEKLNKSRKGFVYEPTIFGNTSKKYIKTLKIAHQVRQLQMIEGEIAQIIFGNFCGWRNLEVGHKTGLDCKKKDKTIIVEVKNKYNTCNSGSQKATLDKLANYKKSNPKTRCVYGIVNPSKNCKNLKKKISHNGVELEKIQGIELFKLVFNLDGIDYSSEIIDYIKTIIYS